MLDRLQPAYFTEKAICSATTRVCVRVLGSSTPRLTLHVFTRAVGGDGVNRPRRSDSFSVYYGLRL